MLTRPTLLSACFMRATRERRARPCAEGDVNEEELSPARAARGAAGEEQDEECTPPPARRRRVDPGAALPRRRQCGRGEDDTAAAPLAANPAVRARSTREAEAASP